MNVSMIESTNAFRRFAGDKSWDQLDFQMQQQIRLAAILEQAYARYGNELQRNVMTKQETLIGYLQDTKLHLSQAFLPIWDAVLPALTELAKALASVTEQIARFVYWIRGWDYDEMTRGTDKQTDSVIEQGEAYEELGKEAKAARKELAAFDEINLLGDLGGGIGGGKSGGSGINVPTETPLPIDEEKVGGLKKALEDLRGPWEILFNPIQFPDIGAVATNIIQTINNLAAEARVKMDQMWEDLKGLANQGLQGLNVIWKGFATELGFNLIPSLISGITIQWGNFLNGLKVQLGLAVEDLKASWQGLWLNMLNSSASIGTAIMGFVLNALASIKQGFFGAVNEIVNSWLEMLNKLLEELRVFIPDFEGEWNTFKERILLLANPIAKTFETWKTFLADFLKELQGFLPNFLVNWTALGLTLVSLESYLQTVKQGWQNALSSMATAATTHLQTIIDKINQTISAWATLQSMFGIKLPDFSTVGSSIVNMLKGINTQVQAAVAAGANALTLGLQNKLIERAGHTDILEAQKGAAGTIGEALGIIAGGAGLAKGAASGAAKLGNQMSEWLSNLLKGVPAFANGGIVYGPTLAMVGDNPGAWSNPEIISPRDDLMDMITSAVANGMLAVSQTAQGNSGTSEVVLKIDGSTFARLILPYIEQENVRIGSAQIKTAGGAV